MAIVSGKKTGQLTRSKSSKAESDSVVYKVPSSGSCNKSYIGKAGRDLDTRLKENKRDVRNHTRQNYLVLHLEKCQNLPAWDRAHVIEEGMPESIRKAIEAAHIIFEETLNENPDSLYGQSLEPE